MTTNPLGGVAWTSIGGTYYPQPGPVTTTSISLSQFNQLMNTHCNGASTCSEPKEEKKRKPLPKSINKILLLEDVK